MNERIKQLAEQAANWCCYNAQGTPVAWEWEIKFAELIVQECAGLADSLYTSRIPAGPVIRKHFGVE